MYHRGDRDLSKSSEQHSRTRPSRSSDNPHRLLHGLPSTPDKLKEPAENKDFKWTREPKKDIFDDSPSENIKSIMKKMDYHLIIVSNRGGKEYRRQGQKLIEKSGAGGLSKALANIKNYDVPVKWYSAPMGQGDRDAIAEGLPNNYVDIDPTIYNEYYNGSSNGVLWPLLHDMPHNIELDASQIRKSWEKYTHVNQIFADKINAQVKGEQKPRSMVMIQDYHLLLVPGMLRERNLDILLQHFIHTPWPEHKVWKEFDKEDIVKDIYTGLVGNDIIGFQTENDAKNFLQGVQHYLPDATVEVEKRTILWKGRHTEVRIYPISIDRDDVREKANREFSKQNDKNKIQKDIEIIQSLLKKDYIKIMSAARIDPTKNLEVTLEAYNQMLDKCPRLHGKVVFLTFLTPSREDVPIYQRLRTRLEEQSKMTNEKYGKDGWQPIYLFFGHNQENVLKALKHYNVLVIVPFKDGMNLVVKEGAEVNEKDGVIVLSDGAGAVHQFKDGGAITISSAGNVEVVAEALEKGIGMPSPERKIMTTIKRKAVEAYDLKRWLLEQLRDMLRRKGHKSTVPEDG